MLFKCVWIFVCKNPTSFLLVKEVVLLWPSVGLHQYRLLHHVVLNSECINGFTKSYIVKNSFLFVVSCARGLSRSRSFLLFIKDVKFDLLLRGFRYLLFLGQCGTSAETNWGGEWITLGKERTKRVLKVSISTSIGVRSLFKLGGWWQRVVLNGLNLGD